MTTVIAGVSGAIGAALARRYLSSYPDRSLIGLCRRPETAPDDLKNHSGVRLMAWDAEDEQRLDVAEFKAVLEASGPVQTVIYAAGLLHDGQMFPEKRLEDIDGRSMMRSYQVNCFGFVSLMQRLAPVLRGKHFKRIAAVSAKVGSISDNQLGGWYAYRASKAAMNMVVKNLSIELSRRYAPLACVSLHPGTTLSSLSQPFQQSLEQLTVHEPEQTASNLFSVLESLDARDNGRFISWDGSDLPW
ncbi:MULTISPECIES: SDR family NAD(P)-dependent oxidoreductase [Marinobacter]|jgi:NAD(P)-dependent dehydrogenase (short-subunit alcohol dehydrogenase family)|uniref:Short-chain dehydrogenase/reductase SDR n=1 Tax=Marinobacter nauticus TaxID=2743 RepID=A0A833JP85_MARNT|nr:MULTISPECIES: SDR family NAD(P)-dependent oxidoreductase [Marinobacter]KAE8545519.1 Short-chain dehydrogenase/reductase SDR [Marinobacter nauticus]MCW9011720.1 SDR family NAD(P)-dependent oxidoreductase [Marinobacter sp.]